MESNLNLKGHVEIYDQSGNKILDEHNMITNIGKQMILKNMFQANANTMVKYITFGYGESASIVPNITLADLAKSTNGTDINISAANNDLKNALYRLVTRAYGATPPTGAEAFTYGVVYGNVNTASKSTDSEKPNDFNIINSSKEQIGTFTDDGSTVTYSDNTTVDGDPAVTGGVYIDTSSSQAIVYAKITNNNGTYSTPPLSVIGLSGETSIDPDNGNVLSTGGTKTIYPFTALSFNIGNLAASTTYVIKYTLYM